MFKKRLLYMLKKIGFFLLTAIVTIGIMALLYLFSVKMPKTADFIGNAFLTIFFGFAIIAVLIAIIINICKFINWLFIEPFKNRKDDK